MNVIVDIIIRASETTEEDGAVERGRELAHREIVLIGDEFALRYLKVGKAVSVQYNEAVMDACMAGPAEQLHVLGEE